MLLKNERTGDEKMKKNIYLFFGLALLSNLYASVYAVHSYSSFNKCITNIDYTSLRKSVLITSEKIKNREI